MGYIRGIDLYIIQGQCYLLLSTTYLDLFLLLGKITHIHGNRLQLAELTLHGGEPSR